MLYPHCSNMKRSERDKHLELEMLAHIYIFVFFCLEITTYRFAQRAENSEPGKSDKYIVYLARQREVVFKCHSGSQGLSQVGLCWCSQRRLQENHHPVTRTKKEKVAHALTKPSSICQRDCSEVSRNTDLILKMSWAESNCWGGKNYSSANTSANGHLKLTSKRSDSNFASTRMLTGKKT